MLGIANRLCEIESSGNIMQRTDFSDPSCAIKSMSEFSEDVQMPFAVHGILIQAGDYRDGTVPWDELKASAYKWEGVRIYKGGHETYKKLCMGTEDDVSKKIGYITKIFLNEDIQALEYDALIFDKDIAYKISGGLIEYVSVSFFHDAIKMEGLKKVKRNLVPAEMSLVHNPKCKIASIKPK